MPNYFFESHSTQMSTYMHAQSSYEHTHAILHLEVGVAPEHGERLGETKTGGERRNAGKNSEYSGRERVNKKTNMLRRAHE